MAAPATSVDDWTGEDVSVSQIERELARLRTASVVSGGSDLRTSVMTHVAWVPAEWREPALETLAGLAERHPSRTIVLLPDRGSDADRLDAEVSLRCFPLHGQERHVCSEVIVLHLLGRMCEWPASIVHPLLITSLPFFLRWRGRPPFGDEAFEELVRLVDRFIVDSVEWPDVPESYADLADRFERTAVSDIAWSRGLPWRRMLAERWPGIAEVRELRVAGPRADAFLLAGWLRSRLGRDVELAHDDAERLERVAVDGEELDPPATGRRDASDLLSEELDRFGRDRIYEDAARAAA
jgi:glucose-6-phosphate dehydrogenase assembly protein OpcA